VNIELGGPMVTIAESEVAEVIPLLSEAATV